jgi:signal transduction histidine kinase
LRQRGIDDAFVDFLLDASNHAAKLCRQLTRGVSPLQDANGDLLEALRRLPNSLPPDSGPRLEIEVQSQAPLKLSLERSEHLYRVVQEAVANALKHAHATLIRVHIVVTAETVRVSIEDDGIGIQYGAPHARSRHAIHGIARSGGGFKCRSDRKSGRRHARSMRMPSS